MRCQSVNICCRTVGDYVVIDPLTELFNRRSLDDVTGRVVSHARRRKAPLTVLMVDVDKFKQVNTRFGHLTGDFVLAEIARLLKASIRGSDAAVRYGGDEFLILLTDTTPAGAEHVSKRCRKLAISTASSDAGQESLPHSVVFISAA